MTDADIQKELDKICKGYAKDLKERWEFQQTDEYEELEDIYEDERTLYYLLDDILDLEFTCTADRSYISAEFALGIGGPNIYVDTRRGVVKGGWGNARSEYYIDDEVKDWLDDYFYDMWNMGR
jgi:hypothetical protein